MGTCAHSGNSAGDKEFDSNVFHFLILIKACLILFTHTFTWFFCPLPWLVMSGKVKAPFGPKSCEVHPTNSQSVSSPIMGIEYINGLPPIHYGPFRPKVGIMVHLVMTGLLIYPFSFKELTHI